MKRLIGGLSLFFLVFSAGSVFADTVTLKNGREIRGRLVKENKDFIFVKVQSGGVIRIEKNSVVTFTEDERDGSSYVPTKPMATGSSAVAKEERNDSEGDKGTSSATGGSTAGSTSTKDSSSSGSSTGAEKKDWESSLPEAHASLSEKDKADLLKVLRENRDRSEELLKATKASKEEQTKIDADYKDLGYARKAGNRGRRDQARERLKGQGLKSLPKVMEGFSRGNYYVRYHSLLLLKELVSKTDDWEWYAYHYKLPGMCLQAMKDQSETTSFGVRNEANAVLVKLFGESKGYVNNQDQFRSRSQILADQSWTQHCTTWRQAYTKKLEDMKKKYNEALEKWKNGVGEKP